MACDEKIPTTSIPTGFSLSEADLDHIDTFAAEAWEDLRGARLFVTGGTGFFGLWLLEGLLWANQRRQLGLSITVLSRDPAAFLNGRGRHLAGHPALHMLAGDIANFTAPPGEITHILHAASEGNADGSVDWAGRYLNDAIDGTRRIVALAAERQTRAVLLTSSGAVYRPLEDADDYLATHRVYAESKRVMEMLLAEGARRHGFRGTIARCFCFSGAYLPLNSDLALGNFLRDALAGQDIVVGGDGTPLRSYLYGADLVVWLLRILVKGVSGQPYNVGGDHAVPIGELARRVAVAAGRPESVVIRGIPVPGATPSAYLPDLRRGQGELGLCVRIGLDEGIARSLSWFRGRR